MVMALRNSPSLQYKVNLDRRKISRFKKCLVANYCLRQKLSRLNLLDLPNEVLVHILSHLNSKQLYCNIRPVCRKFMYLAMSPTLWKNIDVENRIPTEILTSWIKSSKLLQHFSARRRNDINVVAEAVSKYCRHLESIKLEDCWGNKKQHLLHSKPLCNLVTRCRRLHTVNFLRCRFQSCKFFRLFSRMRNGSNYTGPMTPKQMNALISSLIDCAVDSSSTIGNADLGPSHRIRLEELVRVVRDETRMINDIWEDLRYGRVESVDGVPRRNVEAEADE